MGRQPCCEKEGVKKGPWSAEEDRKLVSFITSHGHGCWREVPKRAGLQRCGKSCRLRWINYLRPDLKRGMLSADEEGLIIHLHACHGNKWSKIASHLPGRTDNEIKNCWNTRIKKKLREMGVDPVTHKPISKAPPTVTASSAETRRAGPALQRTGVNAPPCLGHRPFHPLDAAAYLHNMQITNTSWSHEAMLNPPPRSVMMSTHVTSCLSHTSLPTTCEDEHSNYSADSIVTQDQSISSNVQNNMHALATHQEGLTTSDSHPTFTSTPIGKPCLQNMLSNACQIPPLHELHNHPHMPIPPHPFLHNLPHAHARLETPIPLHILQKEAYVQNPFNSLPHNPQKPSPTPLHHPLHISQPMAQPMRYIPALQPRGSQPSFPSSEKVKPSSSSTASINDVGFGERKEGHVNRVEGEEETEAVTSKMIKYVKEGGGLAKLVQCEVKGEGDEGGNNGVRGGQDWSSMMSEAFLSDALEGAPEPQGMSAIMEETSQALGQQSVGLACNSFINGGPWGGNMDGLLTSDPMGAKYSFY